MIVAVGCLDAIGERVVGPGLGLGIRVGVPVGTAVALRVAVELGVGVEEVDYNELATGVGGGTGVRGGVRPPPALDGTEELGVKLG